MNMARSPALALLVLAASPAAAAEEPRPLDYGITLATGYDSNPLHLAERGAGAAYADLRGALAGRLEVGRGTELFASGAATTRVHERRAHDADASYGDVKAGVHWTNRASRRVDISAAGRFTAARSTFTDRLTGDVYVSGAPLPDRFDSNTTGGLVEIRWAPQRRLRLQLGTEYERRSYVEDYAGIEGVDPLDSSAWLVTPRVRILVSQTVAIEAGADWSSRTYDALPAVDASGGPVEGVARRDRGTAWRVTVDARPSSRWDVSAGVIAAGRRDLEAGYFDTRGQSAYVLAGMKAGRTGRVQIYGSLQNLDYPQATLTNDPNAPHRGSDALRTLARYERPLRPGVTFATEAGIQRTGNRDPLYAYDRDWIQTAIRFKR